MVATVALLRLSEGWAPACHHLSLECLDLVGLPVHEDIASSRARVLGTVAAILLITSIRVCHRCVFRVALLVTSS